MDTPGDRIRASDPEREQYAQLLRTAMTEGRLTLEEGENRLAKVYAAVYRDELDPLTTDLPGGGWWALQQTPEFQAEHRDRMRRFVWRKASIVAIVAGVWLTILLATHTFVGWPFVVLGIVMIAMLRRRAWRRYHRWNAGSSGWQGGPGPWSGGPASQGQGPWAGAPWHHGGPPWAGPKGAGPWGRAPWEHSQRG
jgi:hypothetical protein